MGRKTPFKGGSWIFLFQHVLQKDGKLFGGIENNSYFCNEIVTEQIGICQKYLGFTVSRSSFTSSILTSRKGHGIMKIKEIWLDADYIYGKDEEGHEYKQSLLWYSKLRNANNEERSKYIFGLDGIHWRNLDEDISFESFEYEDAEPSALQRFFLSHKEINVAEFARSLNMNPTLLRNYINGFKKPSKEREQEIINHIHKLGEEMLAA